MLGRNNYWCYQNSNIVKSFILCFLDEGLDLVLSIFGTFQNVSRRFDSFLLGFLASFHIFVSFYGNINFAFFCLKYRQKRKPNTEINLKEKNHS